MKSAALMAVAMTFMAFGSAGSALGQEYDQWPVTAEFQLAYILNQAAAIYVDGLVGIGRDRPYNVGMGLGLRFKY